MGTAGSAGEPSTYPAAEPATIAAIGEMPSVAASPLIGGPVV